MPLLTKFQTFFISPFSEPSATAELNNFLKSHRIINIEKKLIDGERGTGWVFLIEYGDNEADRLDAKFTSKVDYKDVLTPTEFAIYDLLRQERKRLTDNMKIPAFAIFTNEQLAEMAQKTPKTMEELSKIKGMTEQKIKAYGHLVVGVINNALVNMNVENESK